MDFKPAFHIVVVGAGLAGLASAILLRKTSYNVTVLEQDPELRDIGAGIQLPPNSTRILDEIGVLQKVVDSSVEPPSMVLYSYQQGNVLHNLVLDPHSRQVYGAPYLVIHRADLRRILYETAVAQGVNVRFGVQIDSKKTDFGDGIIELTASVDENKAADVVTIKADLVIGADGTHSACREALLQRPDPPKPVGTVVSRIVIDAKRLHQNPRLKSFLSPPNIQCWLGPESLAICYLLKDMFNIVLTRPEKDEHFSPRPRPADIEDLRSFFSDWDPRIRELLGIVSMSQSWSLLENEQPPSWIHPGGRFVLLGDAVHSTLPYLAQGAAISFESASVLSNLLSKARAYADMPELLHLYSATREPRTSHVIRASKKTCSTWQMPNGPLQIERDRQFGEETPPSAGYPNMLGDPIFQTWLWGFDARRTAEAVWECWKNGGGLVDSIYQSSLQRLC